MKHIRKFNDTNLYYKFRSNSEFIKGHNVYKVNSSIKYIDNVYDNYVNRYLTIELLENSTLKFKRNYSGNVVYYSIDKGLNWIELQNNVETEEIEKKTIIYLKGNFSRMWLDPSYGSGQFTLTGKFKLYGNIMSLIYMDDFKGKTILPYESIFRRLFDGVPVVDITKLILPSTILTNYCYASMFVNSNYIEKIPKLLGTTIGANSYGNMFKNSIKLKYVDISNISNEYIESNIINTPFFKKSGADQAVIVVNNNISEENLYNLHSKYPKTVIIKKVNLPKDYIQVTYVASTQTGGQYVDLNLHMWNISPLSYSLCLTFKFLGKGIDNITEYSTILSNSDWGDLYGSPGFDIKYYPNKYVKQTSNGYNKDICRINEIGNISETYGDETEMTYESTNGIHDKSVYLFCDHNSSGEPFKFSEARIYDCKIKSNGSELVRNLIPCINPQGIPGLYDLVNGVFYKSLGNEELIAGPKIEEAIYLDNNSFYDIV